MLPRRIEMLQVEQRYTRARNLYVLRGDRDTIQSLVIGTFNISHPFDKAAGAIEC